MSYVKPRRKSVRKEKPKNVTEETWERNCIRRRYKLGKVTQGAVRGCRVEDGLDEEGR
jgi:hypothetical protein